MSFIHPFSDEATSSQLELFKIPQTVTAIEVERTVHYKPIAALTSSNWIEFRVTGNDDFIDLSSIQLEVEVKVTMADGTPLPKAESANAAQPNLFEAITPVNDWLWAMFQQIDLYLNNTLVTSATNLHHYRAYMDDLFYTSKEAKQTYMYSHFWEADEAKRKARFKRCYEGKSIKMMGPLHLDLAQQERLLLNHVDMNLRLNLSDTSFFLKIGNNTSDKPRCNIINATLHLTKKRLFADCEAGIMSALGSEPCKYFYTHTQMRHRIIDSGSSTFFFDDVFPGTLPRRFVIGLVPASAFNGDWKEDPFKFTANGLVEVKALVDAVQVPTPPLDLNTGDDDFSRAYTLFYSAMYSLHPATRLSITPEDFKNSCCFFAWTLSPENDMEDGDTIGLIHKGTVRLDFRFSKPPEKQIAAVIYAHFPQSIQIDANRNVTWETV